MDNTFETDERSEIKRWSGGKRGFIINSKYNDIFRLCFGESKYLNHFYLLILDKKSNATDVRLINSKNFLSEISRMKGFINKDIYISANPFKKAVVSGAKFSRLRENPDLDTRLVSSKDRKNFDAAMKRSNNNVFSLRNIVIDVDFHGYDPDTTQELLCNFEGLFDELFENIPIPNIIHNTGRGFQFWYTLEETSIKLKWKYSLIQNKLIEKFNEILRDNVWLLDGATVDKCASSNISGLFRLFGTYNSMAGVFCDPKIIKTDRYSLNELSELLDIKLYSDSEREQFKKNMNKKIASKQYFDGSYHNSRVDFMIKLIKLRNAAVGRELRDYFIFHIYNELVQINDNRENIREQILEINKLFKQPLSITEIQKICRGVDKVGFYKYSTHKILDNLCVTDKEIEALEFSYRPDFRAIARERKIERNKQILSLAKEKVRLSDIAKTVGCCLNTVKTVIKTNAEIIAEKAADCISSKKINSSEYTEISYKPCFVQDVFSVLPFYHLE